jgi:alpha-amylase/alpha-mannosidase (GH57 family)
MTQVAFLWHMHQPYYEDLVTHEHILPWVRLHALKDYYGMVALLREFPRVRMTFNLVPSLLVQLEAFAENRANDRYLETGLKPAVDLTQDDVVFILQNSFHAHRPRMIDVYPRYAELLAKRGAQVATAEDAAVAARRFNREDLRDLQVWSKLAWLDPFYLDDDERVRRLLAKQRYYSEEDKHLLRTVELELLNAVIPEYRSAAERGQIEISTSPFYHPILPLLCDTDIYKRTHPDSRMPRQRFRRPEDAFEQLTRAVACHQRLFGAAPTGLWPSEGSVSDDMVPLVAQAGFRWMATDEMILARTLNTSFGRDARGQVDQPEQLYTPYIVHAGGARVSCVFRDHALSDLIGFNYAGWPADAAADDFVGRLQEAGRRYSAKTGREAVIPIVLDGENAWEHFEGGGRPFLRALYSRLSEHPELRTVTIKEACAGGGPELSGIFPGSWIDANFYIWIGHADDHKAWGQLGEARQALDEATGVDPAALEQAREELFVAEGSDWCWWYGDDHSTEHDLDFDELYRRHLRNVYRLLGRPIPDELFVTNISTVNMPSAEAEPTGLISPVIDGEESSYFEWLGAGSLEVRQIAGAMHQVERTVALVEEIRFGFDRSHLYVRVDAQRSLRELLAEGYELTLKFLKPDDARISLRAGSPSASGTTGSVAAVVWRRVGSSEEWLVSPAAGVRAASGTVLELAIPLAALRGSDENRIVSFFVAVTDRNGVELERHPAHRPIEGVVPDERFEAMNWTA